MKSAEEKNEVLAWAESQAKQRPFLLTSSSSRLNIVHTGNMSSDIRELQVSQGFTISKLKCLGGKNSCSIKFSITNYNIKLYYARFKSNVDIWASVLKREILKLNDPSKPI